MHGHNPHHVGIALLQFPFNFNFILFNPRNEPLQRRNVFLLICQRQIDKLVQTVFNLIPHPLHEFFAPAERTQHITVKFKRPNIVGLIQQILQNPVNSRVFFIFSEPCPNRCRTAAVTQTEQIVVIQAEQRRLQNRCQRQIVIRQQQKLSQSNQILYGNLFQQPDFINSRDIYPGIFAFANHLFHKSVAALHQYHKILVTHRPIL